MAASLLDGCGYTDVIAPPPIHDVIVYTWPTYVQVGDTLRVEAGAFNDVGLEFTQPIRTVAWQTSNPQVISIEPAVAIVPIQPSVYARGVAPGTAHISATLNGITGTDSVIVLPRLQGVKVTPVTATIHVGQWIPVTAQIIAADGTVLVGPYIIWESSNYNVAAPGPGNTVVSRTVGVARITATLARAVGALDVTVVP
ncbi:MAG: hypothetical protein ABI322_09405 [Gemmatimonadaceae bacterium]